VEDTQLMKLLPSCCECGLNQDALCVYCFADNLTFAAQFDEPTVKRPFMRHPPCSIECRCDGDQVYALMGTRDTMTPDSAIGYGDTLPDALRALADEVEKEVEVKKVPCVLGGAKEER
jgi:hypothetical protein